MKYRTRIILVALLMALLPLRHFGQTPYRQYADEGIILNFFEIGNPDFRLYLLYNLEHDGRFSLQAEEENGLFVVNPSEDYSGTSFFDTFEMFYNNTFADFRLIDKVDLFDLVPQWKERVTALYFTSITLDIAMTRAMNENNHCVDSNPFCTSDLIQFQAANSSQTADQLEGVLIRLLNGQCIGAGQGHDVAHVADRVIQRVGRDAVGLGEVVFGLHAVVERTVHRGACSEKQHGGEQEWQQAEVSPVPVVFLHIVVCHLFVVWKGYFFNISSSI